ncbi:MAG: orotidine-5'-phosphate decarboxylase [Thermoplasmata archaeon]
MKKRNGIILALDVESKERALFLTLDLADIVDAIKIGYPLVLSSGISIVKEISKISPVICDFKVADIPNTNKIISRIVKENGASGIIVHGFVGSDSIKAVVDEFSPGEVFSVVEMTHEGAIEIMQSLSMVIANLSYKSGVKGFIVPGTRPERIKLYREKFPDMQLLVPGIGVQGGDARIALKNGADFLIIGRSIYNSENPRKVVEGIIDSLQ